MTTGEYCRAVESFLCRQNDGHLIRVVGPAFEMVCGWEKAGIPLGVVARAIEQKHLRYGADGPRRRPRRAPRAGRSARAPWRRRAASRTAGAPSSRPATAD